MSFRLPSFSPSSSSSSSFSSSSSPSSSLSDFFSLPSRPPLSVFHHPIVSSLLSVRNSLTLIPRGFNVIENIFHWIRANNYLERQNTNTQSQSSSPSSSSSTPPSPSSDLVILLNFPSIDIDLLNSKLIENDLFHMGNDKFTKEKHGVPPKVYFITAEISANQRISLYKSAKYVSVTTRILVVDLLRGVIHPKQIKGFFVHLAGNLLSSLSASSSSLFSSHSKSFYHCLENFILRLYRQQNRSGFIKVIGEVTVNGGGERAERGGINMMANRGTGGVVKGISIKELANPIREIIEEIQEKQREQIRSEKERENNDENDNNNKHNENKKKKNSQEKSSWDGPMSHYHIERIVECFHLNDSDAVDGDNEIGFSIFLFPRFNAQFQAESPSTLHTVAKPNILQYSVPMDPSMAYLHSLLISLIQKILQSLKEKEKEKESHGDINTDKENSFTSYSQSPLRTLSSECSSLLQCVRFLLLSDSCSFDSFLREFRRRALKESPSWIIEKEAEKIFIFAQRRIYEIITKKNETKERTKEKEKEKGIPNKNFKPKKENEKGKDKGNKNSHQSNPFPQNVQNDENNSNNKDRISENRKTKEGEKDHEKNNGNEIPLSDEEMTTAHSSDNASPPLFPSSSSDFSPSPSDISHLSLQINFSVNSKWPVIQNIIEEIWCSHVKKMSLSPPSPLLYHSAPKILICCGSPLLCSSLRSFLSFGEKRFSRLVVTKWMQNIIQKNFKKWEFYRKQKSQNTQNADPNTNNTYTYNGMTYTVTNNKNNIIPPPTSSSSSSLSSSASSSSSHSSPLHHEYLEYLSLSKFHEEFVSNQRRRRGRRRESKLLKRNLHQHLQNINNNAALSAPSSSLPSTSPLTLGHTSYENCFELNYQWDIDDEEVEDDEQNDTMGMGMDGKGKMRRIPFHSQTNKFVSENSICDVKINLHVEKRKRNQSENGESAVVTSPYFPSQSTPPPSSLPPAPLPLFDSTRLHVASPSPPFDICVMSVEENFLSFLEFYSPTHIIMSDSSLFAFRSIEIYCSQLRKEQKYSHDNSHDNDNDNDIQVHVLSYANSLESSLLSYEIDREKRVWDTIIKQRAKFTVTRDSSAISNPIVSEVFNDQNIIPSSHAPLTLSSLTTNSLSEMAFGETNVTARAHAMIAKTAKASRTVYGMDTYGGKKQQGGSNKNSVLVSSDVDFSSSANSEERISNENEHFSISRLPSSSSSSGSSGTIIVDIREFRSSLPSMLHKWGFHLIPSTLTIGDYLLGPNICIERKALSDLIQSLATGRLFNQLQMMSRHFQSPVVLIEFDTTKMDEKFQLVHKSELPSDISSKSLHSKLALCCLHFPRMKFIWSKNPQMTIQLFAAIKKGNAETFDKKQMEFQAAAAASPTSYQSVDNDDELSPFELLSRVPGVNSSTIWRLLRLCNSLHDLPSLSLNQIENAVGSIHAKKLFNFIHQKIKFV